MGFCNLILTVLLVVNILFKYAGVLLVLYALKQPPSPDFAILGCCNGFELRYWSMNGFGVRICFASFFTNGFDSFLH